MEKGHTELAMADTLNGYLSIRRFRLSFFLRQQMAEIAQKTEESIGSYDLHDFFLYHMLRNHFSPSKIFVLAQHAFKDTDQRAIILKTMKTFYRRFFTQQFKRNCMPDGVKVGSVCLSPRGDWRMPSDAIHESLDEVKSIIFKTAQLQSFFERICSCMPPSTGYN